MHTETLTYWITEERAYVWVCVYVCELLCTLAVGEKWNSNSELIALYNERKKIFMAEHRCE